MWGPAVPDPYFTADARLHAQYCSAAPILSRVSIWRDVQELWRALQVAADSFELMYLHGECFAQSTFLCAGQKHKKTVYSRQFQVLEFREVPLVRNSIWMVFLKENNHGEAL